MPKVYGYCSDPSVVGAEFYVMDYVQGRIFEDVRLKVIPEPEERRKMYVLPLSHVSWLTLFAAGWQQFTPSPSSPPSPPKPSAFRKHSRRQPTHRLSSRGK